MVSLMSEKWGPCGVMAKVLDYGLELNVFELQSLSSVYFRANTLRKSMNPLSPQLGVK